MDTKKTFSQRLKEARKKNGYTQADIAKEIGTTQGAYQKWETGSREPNFENLIKLASILNTTTSYLLGETELDVQITEDNIPNLISNLSEEQLLELAYDRIIDTEFALLIASKEANISVEELIKDIAKNDKEKKKLKEIHQATHNLLKNRSGNNSETTDTK